MVHDIGVIAPDKGLTLLFDEVRQETTVDFTLREGLFEEGVEAARTLVAEGATVLISRGETTTQIRSSGIAVPIVDVPISVHDVIPLIDKARHFSTNIAVVGFGAIIRAAEVVAPILSVKLERFRLTSARDIPGVVQHIKDQGFTVMVGTPKAVEIAVSMGLRGFKLESQKSVLHAALAEAAKLAELVRRENEWRLRQQTFMDSARENVLFLDSQGLLASSDRGSPCSAELCDILFDKDNPGEPIRHKEILKAVRRGEVWRGDLRDASGDEYLCRVHPVAYAGRNFGAMLLLEKMVRIKAGARRDAFQKGLLAHYTFDSVVHAGSAMQEAMSLARSYASVDSTVLIQGESGTGKELMAQSIHNASRRRHGPFVAVNCSAMPEQLLESELFGYQEGAFTGARRDGRTGLFEMAHSGTIFLDEIGEMALSMQAKLLRAVEERSIMRLGGEKIIPLDVRVVCATNRNLEQCIREKNFRQDLYFRLNILRLVLPPLRERGECLPTLVRHFLRDISGNLGWPQPGIEPEAMALLRRYAFPGNVRELRSLLERLVVTCRRAVIAAEDVARHLEGSPESFMERDDAAKRGDGALLRREEMRLIRRVLKECNGNRAQAAKRLGISTATLWRRLNKA